MEYRPEELRRLQLSLVEIVKDIDRVCRDNGIAYFLDSGSCLGAVRHAGFIPWDDDMDLGMFREDYDRFLEIAPVALGDDYVVVHPGSDRRLAGMFAKVWKRGTVFATHETIEAGIPQGIFVDIFPYDAVSPDPSAASKQLRDCRFWQSVSYLYHSGSINVPHGGVIGALERGGCKAAHGLVHAFLSPERIRASFDSAALSAPVGESTGLYGVMAYADYGPFPRDVMLPVGSLPFEGVDLPVPGDYRRYLEICYGSTWNELPPENERRNHAPVELGFGE